MPRLLFTDRFVAGARAEKTSQVEFFDARTPGLALRISRGGRKAWAYHFTSPASGKRARMSIGSYPATPLAAARTRVIEAKRLVEEGRDPRGVSTSSTRTISDLIELFLEKHARPNLRSAGAIERRLLKNVVPIIGSVRAAQFDRRDMNRVVDPVLGRGRRVEATRVFEDLRSVLRWAARRGDLERNPVEGMARPHTATARERVLSADELRHLWGSLAEVLSRSEACQRIVKLCLATGQRVGEVAGLQVAELDLQARLWLLPGLRTKNGHAHAVPLSEMALSVVKESLPGARGPFVFANASGGAPLPPMAVARTIARAQERFGLAHWTMHDLRRTAITGMAELGVAPIVMGHVVNHRSVTKAGVTLTVYSHYDYAREKRDALDRWGARLASIVGDEGADAPPGE